MPSDTFRNARSERIQNARDLPKVRRRDVYFPRILRERKHRLPERESSAPPGLRGYIGDCRFPSELLRNNADADEEPVAGLAGRLAAGSHRCSPAHTRS
jgi:hypothetical protein